MATERARRRQLILEAAERLFRHYGHGKTTMADIAREADIAVGSVYLDFPSKEAIVEELSSSAHVRVLDAMRHAARKNGRNFAARLMAVFEARAAAFVALRDNGAHARELFFCRADGVRSASARFQEEERAYYRQLLEDAADERQAVDVDPRRLAALLQRAQATLSPPWIFDEAPDEATRVAREMATLVLAGLLPRERAVFGARPAKRAARPRRR